MNPLLHLLATKSINSEGMLVVRVIGTIQNICQSLQSDRLKHSQNDIQQTGPSCSKLTMSLVNDSLKFTSSDTQIR